MRSRLVAALFTASVCLLYVPDASTDDFDDVPTHKIYKRYQTNKKLKGVSTFFMVSGTIVGLIGLTQGGDVDCYSCSQHSSFGPGTTILVLSAPFVIGGTAGFMISHNNTRRLRQELGNRNALTAFHPLHPTTTLDLQASAAPLRLFRSSGHPIVLSSTVTPPKQATPTTRTRQP